MIRKILRKLTAKIAPRPKPAVLNAAHYGIAPEQISPAARRVCETLQRNGHQGLIVGGAVRDLILGRKPKDFDVATDAPPERVRALFRRSRIIGRRFRIVHVYAGRETVEVTTFRAHVDPNALATDEHGRILEDNVFGTIEEDALRRDFTANALYYDPIQGVIHDFHHGVGDLQAGVLRMIGDPEKRYREDPVRMLRAVRLATKLGLTIDAAARAPLRRLAPLLANVPQARLVDELIKVLTSGRALHCLARLQEEGLAEHALAPVERLLAVPHYRTFLEIALDATDRRIHEGKPVSPAFTLGAMLWPVVREAWVAGEQAGLPRVPALQAACDEVLSGDFAALALTRAMAADMRELWLMQPRFEKRAGKYPYRLLTQPRYRAAWDFLMLRVRAGEVPEALGMWWERFAHASEAERAELIRAVQQGNASGKKKRRRRKRAKPRPADAAVAQTDAAPPVATPSKEA
jgi:poly(A) polymerase